MIVSEKHFDTVIKQHSWGRSEVKITIQEHDGKVYNQVMIEPHWQVISFVNVFGNDGLQKIGWELERIKVATENEAIDQASRTRRLCDKS